MSVEKAFKYVEDVRSGEIPTCKLTKLSIKRHIEDMKRDDIYIDTEAAERVFSFCSFVTLVEGEMAGQRFEPTPEQSFILLSVFGWKRKKNGKRRFTVVDLEVARIWKDHLPCNVRFIWAYWRWRTTLTSVFWWHNKRPSCYLL